MDLSLSAADVTALEQRTEGWIAGLQMAALGPVFKKWNATGLVWLCILVVSFLEPIFQVRSEQPKDTRT